MLWCRRLFPHTVMMTLVAVTEAHGELDVQRCGEMPALISRAL